MDVEFCRVGDLDGGSPVPPLLPLSSSSTREARGAPVDVVDDDVEGNRSDIVCLLSPHFIVFVGDDKMTTR